MNKKKQSTNKKQDIHFGFALFRKQQQIDGTPNTRRARKKKALENGGRESSF